MLMLGIAKELREGILMKTGISWMFKSLKTILTSQQKTVHVHLVDDLG